MRLLLDTHVLIWWWTDPARLSATVMDLLDDPETDTQVSAVSAYEIELKRPRDPLLQALPEDLLAAVVAEGFGWRGVEPFDAVIAGRLPMHHRDPWDRLLLAQALNDGATLVSRDAAFAAYGIQTLW